MSKSEVFKKAWAIRKKSGLSMSHSLRLAWSGAAAVDLVFHLVNGGQVSRRARVDSLEQKGAVCVFWSEDQGYRSFRRENLVSIQPVRARFYAIKIA